MKINLVLIITHQLEDTNSLQVTLKSDIGYPIHHYLQIVQFTMDGFVFVERFAFFLLRTHIVLGQKWQKIVQQIIGIARYQILKSMGFFLIRLLLYTLILGFLYMPFFRIFAHKILYAFEIICEYSSRQFFTKIFNKTFCIFMWFNTRNFPSFKETSSK